MFAWCRRPSKGEFSRRDRTRASIEPWSGAKDRELWVPRREYLLRIRMPGVSRLVNDPWREFHDGRAGRRFTTIEWFPPNMRLRLSQWSRGPCGLN